MSSINHTALVLTVEPADFTSYDGYYVKLNNQSIYYRPYDGSNSDEVLAEAVSVLGDLIRMQLGFPADLPKEETVDQQSVHLLHGPDTSTDRQWT